LKLWRSKTRSLQCLAETRTGERSRRQPEIIRLYPEVRGNELSVPGVSITTAVTAGIDSHTLATDKANNRQTQPAGKIQGSAGRGTTRGHYGD